MSEEKLDMTKLSSEEFDAKICADFPLLYRDRNASMRVTCMCWGFTIGTGWHQIVYDLSAKLEALIQKWIDEHEVDGKDAPRASQVKEKFGSLRFYMDGATDEMRELIRVAEALSSQTCETCGAPGKNTSFRGWYRTVCEKHSQKVP